MQTFPETADIETASDAYASRFAGPVGAWMLAVQRDAVLRMMGPADGAQVLDVGGGHGQLARPLCERGAAVTVLGSDDRCRQRIDDLVRADRCRFRTGNVIDLPFEDKAFGTVLCFRLVCHCNAWEQLIGELCRVASSQVIIDYPTSESVNALTGLMFGMKKKLEGNTRTYTLFRNRQIRDAFSKYGFRRSTQCKQFFWPMVLHRILKSHGLSKGMEEVARWTGLTRLLGSPVIVSMIPER